MSSSRSIFIGSSAAAVAAIGAGLGASADMGPVAMVALAAIGAATGAVGAEALGREDGATANGSSPARPARARTSRRRSPGSRADLLDRLPAPVILAGPDLRLTRANHAAETLFGPARRDAPLVELIRSPDLIDALEACLSDGAPQTLDFSLRRSKDERLIRAHIRTLAPAEPGLLIQFEDQTRARALEEMREAFVANASHELRTPLASIIGFIETLQGPARDDDAARVRFLKIMAAQADRMRRLVEDLLSLSRIEMSAHMRPRGEVDLGAVAHEAAAALEMMAKGAGASLHVDAPQSGPVTAGDRDQIAQLITNLIDNAIKYGGDGVTVRVGLHPPALERPGMVGLTVADDGPGVAREHLPRLTERFYRVSAQKSRAVGGTGLGLAIAKHILQRHRGDLSIRSRPGEGSAFTAWLPARSDSQP